MERWNPRADIERVFEEMDRLVPAPLRRGRLPRPSFYRQTIDVYETPEQLVIKALLPGARPEDIDIAIDQNTLTIRGHYGYTLSEEEAEHVTWHYHEIGRSAFAESIPLPVSVDVEQVTATLEEGILTVALQKTVETRARRIPVRTVEPTAEPTAEQRQTGPHSASPAETGD